MKLATLRRASVSLALATLVAGILSTDVSAGPTSRKMDRQISLFENVVDDMLVESPNWLVRGRENARGTYVEGHGMIVTFDASLVNWDHGDWWSNIWKKGKRHSRRSWDDEDWEDDRSDRRKWSEEQDRWYEHELKRGERLYKRGKAEIVDVILDFGEFLSTLEDGDVLEVEAFLGSAPYFIENDLNTLSLKVKMSDLRQFSAGSLTDKQLVDRIEVSES